MGKGCVLIPESIGMAFLLFEGLYLWVAVFGYDLQWAMPAAGKSSILRSRHPEVGSF